ncbi:hypothetical protein OV207_18065 [Corallococcus sp. BB11-1]|uniref:hypothetical protein n=1 Tax=Corallococcus sp. BB11-1 TaxID=2996783 RepID=UPI00226D4D7F|nr:hypothetical protein [Corallococcus sp. BB11-1]MCY1033365.1 hypothetical protein [Corallococcus sp. BB11-1]
MDATHAAQPREVLQRWMRLLALRHQHQHVSVLIHAATESDLVDLDVAREAACLLARIEARELEEFLALERALERVSPADASCREACGEGLGPAPRCAPGCTARAR